MRTPGLGVRTGKSWGTEVGMLFRERDPLSLLTRCPEQLVAGDSRQQIGDRGVP
jgi:hypothetical protein